MAEKFRNVKYFNLPRWILEWTCENSDDFFLGYHHDLGNLHLEVQDVQEFLETDMVLRYFLL